ncbi:MAG TPA: hypothetical protein VF766_02825, partial [Pyrinomonadaceae bacterium]
MPAIDPPIIVTGGGGDGLTPSRKPTKNVIQIECDPADSKVPKKFKTKVNREGDITSVQLEFPNMPGQRPIIISGYDVFTIKITFNTADEIKPIKPKPPAKG